MRCSVVGSASSSEGKSSCMCPMMTPHLTPIDQVAFVRLGAIDECDKLSRMHCAKDRNDVHPLLVWLLSNCHPRQTPHYYRLPLRHAKVLPASVDLPDC